MSRGSGVKTFLAILSTPFIIVAGALAFIGFAVYSYGSRCKETITSWINSCFHPTDVKTHEEITKPCVTQCKHVAKVTKHQTGKDAYQTWQTTRKKSDPSLAQSNMFQKSIIANASKPNDSAQRNTMFSP